jgi:Ca-activated chloride channel homolog
MRTRVIGLFLMAGFAAYAQPPGQPTIVSTVNLVLLDVSVTDGRGNFVSGLTREDFHVFDNGVKQSLSDFAKEDQPVTVGLVVDNSGSMRNKHAEVADAGVRLVGESNPRDEIFVVRFNDDISFGLPPEAAFTDNQDQLRAALHAGAIRGRTALYDATRAALDHLERGKQARKALVILSDGGDNASSLSERQILDRAILSRATIYAVGIYDKNEEDRNPGFLKRLAGTTGGEAFFPAGLEDLSEVCSRIARDIRSRYTVGFHAPESAPGEARRLRVTVSSHGRGKLTARTRRSYAIPPAAGKREAP